MKKYCDYCDCEFDEDELTYIENDDSFICDRCLDDIKNDDDDWEFDEDDWEEGYDYDYKEEDLDD